MAIIQPIEDGTVHRIQSGQVIVDLCSVVKELVENSLDAGATSIDVRFKNHGLDSIEVQDNGSGVTRDDYETIALKHFTSKLRSYDDLENLNTFGFRGEALSSLCALSEVHIHTATEEEAPKGSKLVFESSGKLKSTQTVAAQRGTTVAVETIFKNLPVRRQELTKNIKREYGKVLGLLQAYACISTGVKISVSNTIGKKKAVAFSTKPNKTTRENITNVFGTKTVSALVSVDLSFELKSSGAWNSHSDKSVKVLGHISRPIVGGGRQTPDRQMFFVNQRPCALPQVAKVMNEVYKSYNLSQSPFIFADVVLNTNAYDVNVSPDKRTILLHEQGALLDSLKESLTELFENQQQSIPQSKQLPFQALNIERSSSSVPEQDKIEVTSSPSPTAAENHNDNELPQGEVEDSTSTPRGLVSQLLQIGVEENAQGKTIQNEADFSPPPKQRLVHELSGKHEGSGLDDYEDARDIRKLDVTRRGAEQHVDDFNDRTSACQTSTDRDPSRSKSMSPLPSLEPDIPSISSMLHKPLSGAVTNAFERMRPVRVPKQTATITIGNKTTTSLIGNKALKVTSSNRSIKPKFIPASQTTSSRFSSALKAFAAPGLELMGDSDSKEGEAEREETTTVLAQQIREHESSAQVGEEEDTLNTSWPRRQGKWNDISTVPSNSDPSSHRDLQRSKPYDDVIQDEDYMGHFEENEEHWTNSQSQSTASAKDSDGEWLDEVTKKAKEEARVMRLIQEAEETAARPTEESTKRALNLLRGGGKDATTRLTQKVDASTDHIIRQVNSLRAAMKVAAEDTIPKLQALPSVEEAEQTAEARLSLTVSKSDFEHMRIVGQFNLGFVIAVRPIQHTDSSSNAEDSGKNTTYSADEIFIIDQHASDEKFNFERLQATTIVQHQPLARPLPLELTAIEEELVADNQPSLLRNGFVVSLDSSGDTPVGRRCQLISLPMSREVTFSLRDFEELLVLLADSKDARPSKIRKMFAMRACRSSVMVGKSLSDRQMERLVKNMGSIDKPWNCPHGRPTMRHLFRLGAWQGWKEGSGTIGMEEEDGVVEVDWEGWINTRINEEEDD